MQKKRKAIFFSDKDINGDLYARNKECEEYDGEDVGEVIANIKGLKLLNMTYTKDGKFINYENI